MEYVNELDTISAGAAKKEAALQVHRLTFLEATMMVVGSNIGSGVLCLAFRSRLFFYHLHALCRRSDAAHYEALTAVGPG